MHDGSAGVVEILLVEDNPGDVRLTQEVLKGGRILNHLNVVGDGVEALAYLRRQEPFADAAQPYLVLLDLNLPRMSGLEVLAEMKSDPELQRIPVVILTTSTSDADVLAAYDLHANCYITKPVDLTQFEAVIRTIEGFWLSIVRLPKVDVA